MLDQASDRTGPRPPQRRCLLRGDADVDAQPRRIADFATLGEALDYAAEGARGLNFHDARGTLIAAYPYAELRDDALANARRFIALGLKPGDRLALIAETGPEFAAAFFGAVYAGAVAGAAAAADQLRRPRRLCRPVEGPADSCDPALFLYPAELADLRRRRRRRSCGIAGARMGNAWPASTPATGDLPDRGRDDIAYLQYSSGSTRFPHGVAVTHRALLDNLRAHGLGLEVAGQRPLHLLAALVP